MREFAGTLKERITIERPDDGRLETGVRVSGWEAFASCLASIAPEGTGPEREGMSFSAMPRFRVVMRPRDGIAVDQRVRWGNRLLMIRQVLSDPTARDRMTLRCEEVRG